MKFLKYTRLAVLASALICLATPSRADWAESADVSVVRAVPTNSAVQPQNPPAFAWARYPGRVQATGYTLEIYKGGVLYQTVNTTRNFFLPTQAFPGGGYSWRVRPNIASDWSTLRTFVVNASSIVFEVPADAAIRAALLAKPHPRALPAGFRPTASWSTEMRGARGTALSTLTNDTLMGVNSFPLASDSLWPATSTTPSAALTSYINSITKIVRQNWRQLESAALLYRFTGEQRYLTEALRRGDALAALDPSGMTSYSVHDVAHRAIMLSLAKAVDILHADLDAQRKATWLAAVKARVAPMYADLIANNFRLDEQPFDSHGNVAQGYLAAISVLTMGDIPEASTWFDVSFRAYVNSVNVWSGPEGGFANGGAYGMYSMDYAMQIWQPILNATGVNLFKKPWSLGFSNWIAQFIPPGAPGLVFGDMHEDYLYIPELKGFMSRFATPTARWYVNNLTGVEPPLTLMMAPYPMPVDTVTTAAPPPNAALFPSIGWTAMHSSIADRARTSVYFKSSPYGSYNHSHGDQNSLVIDSGGRRLLVEAGYQDYYYSPLGLSWYRQTKSHNAITYNGGLGQPVTENFANLTRKGKIVAFSTTPAVDYAEGDATQAYGGAFSSAIRKVWYFRNENVVVVLDKLAAPTPVTFEWNMHAAAAITQESASKVKITNVDRSLCISSLSGDGTAYAQRTGPANPNRFEDHGVFVKPAAATSGEFLVVLDVNCRRPAVNVTTTSTGRTMTVGTTAITLPR